MESRDLYDEHRIVSREIMHMECENLLSEIKRLQNRREMMSRQLKNVMDLALANVNIRESALANVNVRESVSMRQVVTLLGLVCCT